MRIDPAYFETLFEYEGDEPAWPSSFAIITAYPTTGQKWPKERIEEADGRLTSRLRDRGAIVCRLTGHSPDRTHAEPGWAANVGFGTAIQIGLDFEQDAIYFVEGDDLFVSLCRNPRKVPVGAFRERCAGKRR